MDRKFENKYKYKLKFRVFPNEGIGCYLLKDILADISPEPWPGSRAVAHLLRMAGVGGF